MYICEYVYMCLGFSHLNRSTRSPAARGWECRQHLYRVLKEQGGTKSSNAKSKDQEQEDQE